jgi:hypothetical protein
MNTKKYAVMLFVLCVLCTNANNQVSSFTKLRNGIIPSSWHIPLSIASTATMLIAKSELVECVQNFMHKNDIEMSRRVLIVIQSLSLSSISAIGFAPCSPLYKRTEGEIKRAAEELTKEIVILTEEGFLDADELLQKLEMRYVTDIETHMVEAAFYIESLIVRAEWFNKKLEILDSYEWVPHVDLLREVLQKIITSPLFVPQRSARRWKTGKFLLKAGVAGVVALVAGVKLLEIWLIQRLPANKV